jgi:hypothetical protein
MELEAITWVVGWTALDITEVEESALLDWAEVDRNAVDTEEVESSLLESTWEAIGRSELDVDTRVGDDIEIGVSVTKITVVVVVVRIVTQSMAAKRRAAAGLGIVVYVVAAEIERQEQAEDIRSGCFPTVHL